MNKTFLSFIFLISISLSHCTGVIGSEDLLKGKADNLILSDLLNVIYRPSVSVISDPDLTKPFGKLTLNFLFSQSIPISSDDIEIITSDGTKLFGCVFEKLDDSRIQIRFPADTGSGDYRISFEKLSGLIGKNIQPSFLTFHYDPNAPLLSSVSGEVLDSSFFFDGYLDINFSKSVSGADLLDRYQLSGSALGSLQLSSIYKIKSNLYRLFYTGMPATEGGILNLQVSGITDSAGNMIQNPSLVWKVYGFREAGTLLLPRATKGVVLLASEEILITGGNIGSGVITNKAEIFNPRTKTSRYTVNHMTENRRRHTSVLLPSGKVWIAGGGRDPVGVVDTPLSSTDIFDPVTETFSPGPNLNQARMDHTATLLPSGEVLVIGGIVNEMSSPFPSIASAEIYNPTLGTVTTIGSLNFARKDHQVIRLEDGGLYVFGGIRQLAFPDEYSNDTEKYNEVSKTFSVIPKYKLNFPRHSFSVHKTFGESLVVIGTTVQTEIYQPNVGAFVTGSNQSIPRSGENAIQFSDKKIILIGGDNQGSLVSRIDFYDPDTERFRLGSRLLYPRTASESVMLPDGKVFVIGGYSFAHIPNIEEYSYE